MTASSITKTSQKSKPKTLTQARLREALDYDTETGIFTWNISRGCMPKNKVAGNVNYTGYRRIMVDNTMYLASRLAFMWMEGYFPEHEIDHINRVRDDNRWENLRHVTHMCNVHNSGKSYRNTSSIVGVHWHKYARKWCARLYFKGKNFNLGLHENKTDAAKARWEAEKKHRLPNCNTTSSAYLYLQNNP